ncbi:MAG: nickel/cobalt transporter [Solirubrobacteraceae bacterium]
MSARRSLIALCLCIAGATGLLSPGIAAAHPLGNFSVNRLDVVRVSKDRVDVRWILDQAEIPTFQERDRSPAEVLAAKRAEALRGLELRVDQQIVALRASGPGSIAFATGQGGLRTTRVEVLLTAAAPGAREVRLRDRTFADRLGWRGMIVTAGEGTDTTSDLPATEPTRRLRSYPRSLLQSPADQREITLRVRPGDGAVTAPRAEGGSLVTTQSGGGSESGFAGLFADAAAGKGVLILLLVAAFGWGALHALSPGHGKAMVAAYLVGARGEARHAVTLGAIVTITHTIGVFALGVITLLLSQYVLPEDLYPWLNLTAGLLVLVVGALVLRARLRGVPEGHDHGPGGHTHGTAKRPHAVDDGGHAPGHDLDRGHDHDHAHDHGHDHGHDHAHAHDSAHGHDHGHDHAPDSLRPRVLLAAGMSAGLIPCPSALVVLLGAVAQQKVALGLLLIVTFSLGLAATLTALGLAVVYARGRVARWRPRGMTARAFAVVPALSALVIIVVGAMLTARAVTGVV